MMELKSVGMMTFPTEWKVIKFHGSKPPTSDCWFSPNFTKLPVASSSVAACAVNVCPSSNSQESPKSPRRVTRGREADFGREITGEVICWWLIYGKSMVNMVNLW